MEKFKNCKIYHKIKHPSFTPATAQTYSAVWHDSGRQHGDLSLSRLAAPRLQFIIARSQEYVVFLLRIKVFMTLENKI